MMYSRGDEHKDGTGIIFKEKVGNSIIGCWPVSDNSNGEDKRTAAIQCKFVTS